MLIKERLTVNGEHVGYCVDDDGVLSPVLSKLLYSELYFQALLDSGYRFYSYDPSTIETADGTLIASMVAREATDEEKEWLELQTEQVLTDCFPDSYCSRYYAHKKKDAIGFRKEDSYEINTREELLQYLDDQREYFTKNSYVADYRPLNYFVNPEALFSLDELIKETGVKSYMETILLRHRLRNYKEYRNLINWLISVGALEDDQPSDIEFIQAYYKWGVDGIKDSCTDQKMKLNVDVNFNNVDELVKPSVFENRTIESVLVSSQQYLYHKKLKVDISEITEFGREPIALGATGSLITLKRWNDPNFKYKVVDGWVSHPSSRLYYQFYSDKGYVYSVKISHDKFIIFSGDKIVFSSANFGINSISGDIYYGLDEIKSRQDYYISNLALLKAFAIVKARIKPTPYRNNFEMLISDGVSVPAALTSVCVDTYERRSSFVSNSRIQGPDGKQLLTLDAMTMFMRPVPEGVLTHLQLKESISTFELLDVINSMENIDTGLEFQMDGVTMNLAEYCAKLKFVQSVFDGVTVINHFGDGIITDKISSVRKVLQVILSVIYAEAGPDADTAVLTQLIDTFESGGYIDVDKNFVYCDNAYKGYIMDFIQQRKERGNAAIWMWCTKVYQEISNAPTAERRDYAMEVITVPSSEKQASILRNRLAYEVTQANMSELPEELRDYVKEESAYIAAELFFYILANDLTDCWNGGYYVISLDVGIEGKKIRVPVAEELYNSIISYDIGSHLKIIPLCTYCQMEKLEHIQGYSWMMVNAVITPWRVNAKPGFDIPRYNFMINYLPNESFSSASQVMLDKMEEYQAKVDELAYCQSEDFVVEYTELNPMPDATLETLGTIDQYTDVRVIEDIHLYKRRWSLYATDAKNAGGVLCRLLLKSDIVYGLYAEYYGEIVPTDNEVVFDGSVAANNYLMDMEVTTAGSIDTTALGVKDLVSVKQFSPYDFTFEEMRSWEAIINNTFYPSAPYVIEGNIIIFRINNSMQAINLKELSLDKLRDFENNGICYQLNPSKFLFQSGTGQYVVEVLR